MKTIQIKKIKFIFIKVALWVGGDLLAAVLGAVLVFIGWW